MKGVYVLKGGSPALAPESASSRLDRSTLLDRLFQDQPAERRMSVRYWAKVGVVQVGWGTYKPEQRRPGGRVMSPEERAHNQKRATLRASSQIRRDLLTIAADRMLTLTYRENMMDRTRAIADLTRFNRLMRMRFPNWSSVTVLEWQMKNIETTGRCSAHFHVGISGFYDVNEVREVWLSVVGTIEVKQTDGTWKTEPNGNIDIAFKPDGKGNQYSKLAGYMGKYLAKELDHGRKPGEHRYFRCQIADHPKEVFYIPASCPLGIEKELACEVIQTALGIGGQSVCGFWMSPPTLGGGGFASGEVFFK